MTARSSSSPAMAMVARVLVSQWARRSPLVLVLAMLVGAMLLLQGCSASQASPAVIEQPSEGGPTLSAMSAADSNPPAAPSGNVLAGQSEDSAVGETEPGQAAEQTTTPVIQPAGQATQPPAENPDTTIPGAAEQAVQGEQQSPQESEEQDEEIWTVDQPLTPVIVIHRLAVNNRLGRQVWVGLFLSKNCRTLLTDKNYIFHVSAAPGVEVDRPLSLPNDKTAYLTSLASENRDGRWITVVACLLEREPTETQTSSPITVGGDPLKTEFRLIIVNR